MTSKSKNSVRNYETEIEKCREESNWKKAVELAQQLKSRSPQHESLTHFLIGEGKLEAYLDEWPPIKENMERAQRELSEARGYLTLATDEAGKKAGVALDAHLLLGKLNYACGSYDDALKNYKQAELNTLTEKELPIRSLRIVAESYAIKGLCLEESGVDGAPSRYKQAEREADMVRSFSLASDLTLLYLQRCTSGARAGPTLEAALPRAAALHLRAERPQQAADRYREMLMAVECQWTQSLRITVARQLAELLLRAAGRQAYKPPVASTMVSQQGTLSRRREEHSSEGPWKPKKYTAINQFVPQSPYEEVFLVVLVGEALAARDAVLSQSAEFEAARARSLSHAQHLADLLAPLAARWRQHALLRESLERAMKFSFGCAHVWRQRALATAAAAPRPEGDDEDASAHGREPSSAGIKARAVMSRAKLLCPDDAPLRLVCARTCYNTGEIEEGIELAEEALSIEERLNGHMLARCHLYTGIGYQMKAQRSNSRVDKEAAHASCLAHLLRAVQLDNNDHLAFYHLALQHTRRGGLNDAMDATRSCLRANPTCALGLRVAAALWSVGGAGVRRGRALQAARLAAEHYPHAAWPRAAAARLLLTEHNGEAALAAGKELLSLLNATAEEVEFTAYDTLSDSHDLSVRDKASVIASSLGGGTLARTERAMSDGASSSHCTAPRAVSRAAAWLLLAELCLQLSRVSAAAGCVAEAAALTPYSYLVIYTRGLVHEASAQWEDARECFRNACALNPTHIDSLVHLGSAYYETGWVRLAESVLRSAATLAPERADTWRRLALVLAARGEHLAAADAAAAAVALQPTQSALPLPL